MSKDEFYISVDAEMDGPIPGQNSMLSFAGVAINKHGYVMGEFSRNLMELDGAVKDPNTMAWWNLNDDHKLAYQKSRENTVHPADAMHDWLNWLDGFAGKPVLVGFPVVYDAMFMGWYTVKFTGDWGPLSFSGIDIKTYAMATLKIPYRQCAKRNFPERWFQKDLPHTHVALDDAREQAFLFINMLKENTNG